MQRILEPELMDDMEQVVAYDQADFSQSHGQRVVLFKERYTQPVNGYVLDVGCGSGDVLERFAKALPQATFVAVDGGPNMLELARRRVGKSPSVAERIRFVHALLPSSDIPKLEYQVIMSHSMLHHLHQPSVLWDAIKQAAGADSFIFIGDLRRPQSEAHAAALVQRLSGDEPKVLQQDFYNSLCAAFTADEVRAQLRAAGLAHLQVEEAGETHLLVYGRLNR